jgi:hypothetical protein
LKDLIEKYYAPKKGLELLVKLLESKLNEDLPRIYTKTRINVPSGDSLTPEYKELNSVVNKITESDDLSQRLAIINQFLSYSEEQVEQLSVGQAFAATFVIQEIKEALEKLEASTGGFQMETIIAQLINGTKLADNSIVDISRARSQDFTDNYSLKTLSANRIRISGSFKNLLLKYQQIIEDNKENYIYILVTKDTINSIYSFYEFGLSSQDYFVNLKYPKGFGIGDGGFGIGKTDILITKLKPEYKEDQRIQRDLLAAMGNNFNTKDGYIRFKYIPETKDQSFLNYMNRANSASELLQRLEKLKWLEKNKDRFEEMSDFSIGSGFELSSTFVKGIIEESKNTGSEKGVLDLSDDRIKKSMENYQSGSIPKMLKILETNQAVIAGMNSYFVSLHSEVGKATLGHMEELQADFKRFVGEGDEQ